MLRKLLLLSLCAVSLKSLAYAHLDVYTYKFNAYTKEQLEVMGKVKYVVENYTNQNQAYEVFMSLCPKDKECFNTKINLNLSPKEKKEELITLSKLITYGASGVYDYKVSAEIRGETGFNREGLGTVHVYKR